MFWNKKANDDKAVEERGRIEDMLDDGYTVNEIVAETGAKAATVYRIRSARRPKSQINPKIAPDDELKKAEIDIKKLELEQKRLEALWAVEDRKAEREESLAEEIGDYMEENPESMLFKVLSPILFKNQQQNAGQPTPPSQPPAAGPNLPPEKVRYFADLVKNHAPEPVKAAIKEMSEADIIAIKRAL